MRMSNTRAFIKYRILQNQNKVENAYKVSNKIEQLEGKDSCNHWRQRGQPVASTMWILPWHQSAQNPLRCACNRTAEPARDILPAPLLTKSLQTNSCLPKAVEPGPRIHTALPRSIHGDGYT